MCVCVCCLVCSPYYSLLTVIRAGVVSPHCIATLSLLGLLLLFDLLLVVFFARRVIVVAVVATHSSFGIELLPASPA